MIFLTSLRYRVEIVPHDWKPGHYTWRLVARNNRVILLGHRTFRYPYEAKENARQALDALSEAVIVDRTGSATTFAPLDQTREVEDDD